MPSKVTFASAVPKELKPDATLPALLERMLAKWDFKKRFKDKKVAIKMHLGGNVGYSTINPVFVARVVQAVIDAGGKPFVTDLPDAAANAWRRGYVQQVVGAPIISATGQSDKYMYEKTVNYRSLKTVGLAGNICDADAMIVLSHGKGHGNSGFGGAIKNIAMGCVGSKTRGDIHRLMSSTFKWNSKKCTGCLLCKANCPNNAIKYENKEISIFDHCCKYCMHCQNACHTGAITIDDSGYRYFQHGMALTVKEVLKNFKKDNVFYITALLHITPFCDCWGFTTPAIVPDIGFLASDDIVAIETAALDMIKAEKFIQGSLPHPLKLSGSGHLFKQLHGKDPYIQVEECIKAKLGSSKYKLQEVF